MGAKDRQPVELMFAGAFHWVVARQVQIGGIQGVQLGKVANEVLRHAQLFGGISGWMHPGHARHPVNQETADRFIDAPRLGHGDVRVQCPIDFPLHAKRVERRALRVAGIGTRLLEKQFVDLARAVFDIDVPAVAAAG